jgi:hypothetical protein
VTGTAWEHQREAREALQAIVSGPQPGTAAPLAASAFAAQTLRHPPAGPAPGLLDDPIL